ncbi:UNVERIFIED_ORG: hypothetical protein ABIC62_003963 [Burkholderia sp. 1595]|uniref:Uncharacterized protein n=1 Tax=Paraburkholderia terricola TaxID=169427 RepID=A0ABU1LUK9_9BURK|nr:hypothetical protein [Paraburkholderia terricola]MDR6410418.1 hypothetical protein [Paraburkholderia terricola]
MLVVSTWLGGRVDTFALQNTGLWFGHGNDGRTAPRTEEDVDAAMLTPRASASHLQVI